MATKKAANRVIDGTKPSATVEDVEKSAKIQYRVLRPIRHGKLDLVANDLVYMYPEDAQHLVETNALAPHVVTEQVSRVFDLPATPRPVPDTDGINPSAKRAQITGVEVAAQQLAPGATAPDGNVPVAEVDNQGDVVTT